MLEKYDIWDSSRKLKKLPNGKVVIPVKPPLLNHNKITKHHSGLFAAEGIEFTVDYVELPKSKKATRKTPRDHLKDILQASLGGLWSKNLEKEIPSAWEKHGDLVILSENSFQSEIWKQLGPKLFSIM